MKAMRYDPIVILDASPANPNQILTRGFVDSIENWIDSTPQITVFPDVLRLKDTFAGVEETDDDGDDPFFVLETDGAENVRDIIHTICTQANERLLDKGLSFPFSVNSSSVPDPIDGSENTTWLGSVLHKRKAQGFTWNLAKMFINAFDGSFVRRKANNQEPSGYEYYFEERDASIVKRI